MMILLVFGAVFAGAFLFWAVDVMRNSHPLSGEEIERLAKRRQRAQALQKYEFHSYPIEASREEKSAMKATGEFIDVDIPYVVGPSRIAGLLKSKKHEWIVIAFIRQEKIYRMWWNKGPNRSRVWPFLAGQELKVAISRLAPTAIAVFHNHPNPNPSRYSMNEASDADLKSAEALKRELEGMGICLLEFVCERGSAHLYYASFRDSLVPFEPIEVTVRSANNLGMLGNYALRNELKSEKKSDSIPGADWDFPG